MPGQLFDSILDLESGAIQLAEFLRSDALIESKRSRFFAFFLAAARFSHLPYMRAYYLQFSPWLPSLCQELIGTNRDPVELCRWLPVLSAFKEQAPEHQPAIAAAEEQLRIAAILQSFYAADLRRAAGLIGIGDLTEAAPAPSRLEGARRLAAQAPPPLRDALGAWLQAWEAQAAAFSAHTLRVLLIDSSALPHDGAAPEGMLLPLHAEARERPSDADSDLGAINNRAGFGQQALHWTLQDGLLAARRHMAPGTARRYYTVHFSLAEKSAEVNGTSLGLAAALLAWITCRNCHYRTRVANLAGTAAVTGGIAADGTITPVDALTLGAKIRAAFFSPVERLFLPAANLGAAYQVLDELSERYPGRRLHLQPVQNLAEALQDRNLIEMKSPTAAGRALAAARRSRNKPQAALLTAAAALALLFLLVPRLQWWRDRVPAFGVKEGEEFIIQNRSGEKLWSKKYGFALTPARYENYGKDPICIDDLDGDGQREVIFCLNELSHPDLGGVLLGFDSRGRALWPPCKLSHVVTTAADTQIADRYYLGPIKSVQTEPGQPKMILCSVGSIQDFTCRLVLVDLAGRIHGSYWNSGHIPEYIAGDFNGDGRAEIIAGTYGNEDGRARLAVFDADSMQGASPQSDPRYTLAGIPTAHFLRHFRFPASPLVEPDAYRDVVVKIELLGDFFRVNIANHALVKTAVDPITAYILYAYRFSLRMEPLALLDPPDFFLSRFRDITGRSFGPADRARLEVIEEWDGTAWRSRRIGSPAPASPASPRP